MNAGKITLHHLIETRASGNASKGDAMNALYQTMRECLEAAIDAQVAGKSQLRGLRMAVRCAPALIRFGREHSAALATLVQLLQVALFLIDGAIQQARAQDQDVLSYLSVRITCLIQLDRLADLQARTAAATPQAQSSATAQPGVTAQPPGPLPSAPNSSPPPTPVAPKPLTQRAKWLAAQRARKDAKRSSA